MRMTETKTINTSSGARTIRVQQLPAMTSAKLLIRITKMMGPALAHLKRGDAGLADGVRELFDRLTPDEFEAISRALLTSATVEIEGKSAPLLDVFDAIFTGPEGLRNLLEVVAHALGVNYSSFFGEVAGLGERLLNLQANFKASNTSSGQPSGS